MIHFASPLFDTHPRLIQLRSMLISLFNGEQIDGIHLAGLEHVISVSLGPVPATSTAPQTTLGSSSMSIDDGPLPKVHIRSYTIRLLASGTKIPRVELTPMGPFLDLVLRRHQAADPELLKASLKRPKLAKKDIATGLGKKHKNLEVDEMGDLRGRVHVARQDLSALQTRKMKGLKKGNYIQGDEDEDVDMEDDEEQNRIKRKRTT
jgi:ribosome production factor 2